MSIFSISIRELRPKLPEVVSDVSEHMSRYVITKRGKPACIMLSIDDYDSLLESLGLESNEKLMKELTKAEAGFKKGKGRLVEEVRRGL